MKKLFLLTSLFVLQINFAQNTFPTTGNIYFDTSLKIGKQEAPATTIGEIVRLSLSPYGHTGGPWNFKTRDISNIAFLDIDYGITGSALTISSDKNVGIGTTNPAQKLEVYGNGLFKGAIISSYSDIIGGQIKLENPSKIGNGTAKSWNIYNMTGHYGNSLQFWAYDNLGCLDGGMCVNRFTLMDNGNVGIGTTTPDTKLTVNGNIHAKEVKIDLLSPMTVPDYVFAADYKLKSLKEVEDYIKENSHLPEIPSAKELEKNGLMLAEMNMSLLKKIEELTLYTIEQNKKLEKQNEKILVLEDKVKKIETASK